MLRIEPVQIRAGRFVVSPEKIAKLVPDKITEKEFELIERYRNYYLGHLHLRFSLKGCYRPKI